MSITKFETAMNKIFTAFIVIGIILFPVSFSYAADQSSASSTSDVIIENTESGLFDENTNFEQIDFIEDAPSFIGATTTDLTEDEIFAPELIPEVQTIASETIYENPDPTEEVPVYVRSKIEPVSPPLPSVLLDRPLLPSRPPQPVRMEMITPPPLKAVVEEVSEKATTTVDTATSTAQILPSFPYGETINPVEKADENIHPPTIDETISTSTEDNPETTTDTNHTFPSEEDAGDASSEIIPEIPTDFSKPDDITDVIMSSLIEEQTV